MDLDDGNEIDEALRSSAGIIESFVLREIIGSPQHPIF
jgi:hypothetical protein